MNKKQHPASKTHVHTTALGLALASALAAAAPGDLDPGFGTDGKVLTSFSPASADAADVAVQADGKIVQAGTLQDAAFSNADALLVRYNVDGGLDAGFGTGGKTTVDYGEVYDGARAVKILADGKILTAGSATSANNTSRMVVSRHNADGSLDTSFGDNGLAVASFGTGAFAEGSGLAVQSDGKIVVAGRLQTGDGGDFALARFLPDGSPDTSFGKGGTVSADLGGAEQNGLGLTLQSSGKIVVAGFQKTAANGEAIAIARFNTDGSVDGGFGQNGWVIGDFGDQYIHAYSVTVQADDAILVAGNRGQSLVQPYTETCAVVRYGKDGALDTGFGSGGIFSGGDGACHDVAVTASGQLLVGGTGNPSDFAVYRLDAHGAPDTGFGQGGKALIGFGGAMALGRSLALTGDGKAVISGGVYGGTNDLGLARLDAGASPTPTPTPTPTGSPSLNLDAPGTWRQGEKQTLSWTTQQIDGKRSVTVKFSKNGGARFKRLKTIPNKKGQLAWKPAKAHVTTQGVLKVCAKPTKQAAAACDSANIVVLPKQ